MLYLLNPLQGRIGRGKWWLLQLVVFGLPLAVLFFSAGFLADPAAPPGTHFLREQAMLVIAALILIYMSFCTCLNRLRDSGRSGFWYLAFLFAPYIGTGLMVYFCGIEARKPEDGTSRPRSDPKPADRDARPAIRTARPPHPARKPVFGRR